MNDYQVALETFLTKCSDGNITIQDLQEEASMLASHLHQYDVTPNEHHQTPLDLSGS